VEARARALLVGADVLHLVAALAEAARGLGGSASAAGSGGGAGGGGGGGGAPSAAAAALAAAAAAVPLEAGPGAAGGGAGASAPRAPPAAAPDLSRNGAATRELCALFLLQLAEWPWARGLMLQAGAVQLLADLARDAAAWAEGGGPGAGAGAAPSAAAAAAAAAAPANTHQGGLAAAQALARLLVTTNPALLSEGALLDAIGPLLRLAREGASSLALFEAGLALTNLGACGGAVREALLARRALGALEALQASPHLMVRRAGTEALTNLAATPAGARLVLRARLPLWLALARCFQAPGEPAADGSAASLARTRGRADRRRKARFGAEVRAAAAAGGAAAPAAAHPAAAAEEGEGEEEGEDDRDTPTAMAAAGALAMAVGAFVEADGDDDDDDADEGSGPGGNRAGASAGAASAAAQRRAYALGLVRRGAVSAMAELLASGHAGLAHRGAAVLAGLAGHACGAAAMLSPLEEAGAEEGDGEAESGSGGGGGGVDAFGLLFLVSQGRDPAAQGAGPSEGVPAAATALARLALRRAMAHSRAEVEAGAREAAAAATAAAGEEGGAAEGEAGEEGGDAVGAGRAERRPLRPRWPLGSLGATLTVEGVARAVGEEL